MSDISNRQQKIAEARRKLLQKRLAAKSSSREMTIPKIESDTPALASSGQQRLWYIQQLRPDSTAYHMTNLTRITGNLNVTALEKSFQKIIENQAILRTGFILRDGVLLQDVQNEIEFELVQKTVFPDNVDTDIQSFVDMPFKLETAPLWRAMLLKTDDTEHYLVMVLHHIISDEWSIDVLWRDLASCYEAYCNDTKPQLPEIDIQYGDYATWHHQQNEENRYSEQLNYWRKQLSGELPILQLPADRPRPPVQQFQGDLIEYRLNSKLSDALQKLSKESNTTLFTTLLAAYQVLLYRYTAQDDILVGIPVANRRQSQTENLIGFFLNTLVMRADFTKTGTFTDFQAQLTRQSLEALKNQDISFDAIVDELKPRRDPGYNPIFQTMFVYQDASAHQPALPDLTLEAIQIDAGVAKFDTTLFARLDGENIQLGLEYDTALFDKSTAESFLAHYQLLLEHIVASPDTDIAEIDILLDKEKSLLESWNQTAIDYPRDSLIQDLITQHPPDAIAVQSEAGQLTYGELVQRANFIARQLLDKDVVADSRVGLCVERSPEMLIGILGILLSGGAYVPIDPAYPEDRIRYILEDAGIDVLVTESHLQETVSYGIECLILGDDTLENPPEIMTKADNLAYMIYTSGSTGQPKGVRVTHRNLVHSTTARFEVYEHPLERFLLLSSFAFDSSLVGIFWTLCQGGTLYLPAHEGEKDIQHVAQLINQYNVTHMLALPSLYQILLDFAASDDLYSLKTVIVAGEACSISLVQDHYAILSTTKLYNEYGPTEGTVWSTVWEIPPDATKMLIGHPVPNMQVQIVDANLNSVPIGVNGEILISGDGIADGYHNRPELTAERFIDGAYRTGDLGRYLPDGTIEFLGRIDHQVKISGYRIETGEIESVLMQYDVVQEAIVIPVQHQTKIPLSPEELASTIIENEALSLLEEIENMSEDDAINILTALPGGES